MEAHFIHDNLFELGTESSLDVYRVQAHCDLHGVWALHRDMLAVLVFLLVVRLNPYWVGSLSYNAYIVEPLPVTLVELCLWHLLLVQDLTHHVVDLVNYLQPSRRDSAGSARHWANGRVHYGDSIGASAHGSWFLPRTPGLFPSFSSAGAWTSGSSSESLLDKLVPSRWHPCRFFKVSS